MPELCREHNIGNSTFYKWRAKSGDMDASPMNRMRKPEAENARIADWLVRLTQTDRMELWVMLFV